MRPHFQTRTISSPPAACPTVPMTHNAFHHLFPILGFTHEEGVSWKIPWSYQVFRSIQWANSAEPDLTIPDQEAV